MLFWPLAFSKRRCIVLFLFIVASTRCDAKGQDSPPVYEVPHPAAVDNQQRSGTGETLLTCLIVHRHVWADNLAS